MVCCPLMKPLVVLIAAVLVLYGHADAGQTTTGHRELLILDQQTLVPVASVTVRVGDEMTTLVSDSSGLVRITLPDSATTIVFLSHVGYRSKRTTLGAAAEPRRHLVYLEPRVFRLPGVKVADQMAPVSTVEQGVLHSLRGRQLDRQMKQTLAATLADEAGLAMRAMGSAPARPVLRGLGADRVMITEDGTKAVDLSATSPDHAVTVEPFTVERIEILRGPQILKHSPTTIGGVVNVARNEIPRYLSGGLSGQIGAYGESSTDGGLGAIQLEGNRDFLALRGVFSRKSTADIRTPGGRIGNTDSRSTDASLGASILSGNSGAGYAGHLFDLKYGIPGGFVGAHPNGVRIEMLKRRSTVSLWTGVDDGWVDSVEVQMSRTWHRHKELEAADVIGSEFLVVDHFGRVDLRHRRLGVFDYGALGLSAEHRDFDIGGLVFTPPSVSKHVAAFSHQTISRDTWHLDLAARIDFGRIEPESEVPDAAIGHIRTRQFATWSAAASVFRSLSDSWRAGVAISRSARHPTIEELYSRGPHLAAYSYEVGNPELDAETGWGAELIIHTSAGNLQAMASAFRYSLDGYIVPRNTGDTNYQTFLPVYASLEVAAVLSGFELRASASLAERWALLGSLGYTRGDIGSTNLPLPMIPPLKGRLALEYATPTWLVSQECKWASRQNRVDLFEEPTAGFAVFNTAVQYQRQCGSVLHSLTLSLDNLLDAEYRNHLSRIKSIFPEAGRNGRLTYRLYF